MKKQAKGLWMAAALVLGLGAGFTAGARPEAQEPQAPSAAGCTRDSDCDAQCDGPGSGACQVWVCYCKR